MDKKTIILRGNLELQSDGDAMQDMRIFEVLDDYVSSDGTKKVRAASIIAERIFGQEGKEKLIQYLEETEGRARPSRFISLLEEAIVELGDDKKK